MLDQELFVRQSNFDTWKSTYDGQNIPKNGAKDYPGPNIFKKFGIIGPVPDFPKIHRH